MNRANLLSRHAALRWMALILTFATALSTDGVGAETWKEEALLHDGSKIVVTRTVERGGRHEIGQEPPIKEQSLTFKLPGTNETVTWEDKFSEDVGGAGFLPMLLGIHNGNAYLVVHPMGCMSFNKSSRPNPPYVIFQYHDTAWERITLQELPAELKIPNLIFSSPDREAKRVGQSIVSAEVIATLYASYRQPEYKTILREEVKGGIGLRGCGKMVPYGKSGWLGLDWFSEQPTYEACLKVCNRKGVSEQNCPCATLFKGAK